MELYRVQQHTYTVQQHKFDVTRYWTGTSFTKNVSDSALYTQDTLPAAIAYSDRNDLAELKKTASGRLVYVSKEYTIECTAELVGHYRRPVIVSSKKEETLVGKEKFDSLSKRVTWTPEIATQLIKAIQEAMLEDISKTTNHDHQVVMEFDDFFDFVQRVTSAATTANSVVESDPANAVWEWVKIGYSECPETDPEAYVSWLEAVIWEIVQ